MSCGKNPDFSYEELFWKRGESFIAGADEVGRGAFAGPVVAASVVFASGMAVPERVVIKDSKKMVQKQRNVVSIWIKSNSHWAIGEATIKEINRFGVGAATQMAFRRSLIALQDKTKIDHLLCDAFYIKNIRGLPKTKQTPIIKGDGKSLSIAAASIIAKVYRDQLMANLSQRYKNYYWEQNKGYGTAMHRQAIKNYGICHHHRLQFVKNYL